MTTFIEFLQEKCFELNEMVTNDDQPEFFDSWIEDLDGQEYIDYATEWKDSEDLAEYNKKSKYNKDHE